MKTDAAWRDQTMGLLKSELKRRNMTYEQLTEKLLAVGVKDSASNIKNKVSRGSFTAVFLVQCLEAIDCRSVSI